MEKKFLKDIKKGEFFKVSEKGKVLVKGDYVRNEKKFECYFYDDINDFRYLKGDKEVIEI